jgi:hypothetical protein
MEYILAGGAEWRPVREPGRTVCPLRGPFPGARSRNPAGGRPRQPGTAGSPGGDRGERASARHRPAHGREPRPGTLPHLRGTCRAVAAGRAGILAGAPRNGCTDSPGVPAQVRHATPPSSPAPWELAPGPAEKRPGTSQVHARYKGCPKYTGTPATGVRPAPPAPISRAPMKRPPEPDFCRWRELRGRPDPGAVPLPWRGRTAVTGVPGPAAGRRLPAPGNRPGSGRTQGNARSAWP